MDFGRNETHKVRDDFSLIF